MSVVTPIGHPLGPGSANRRRSRLARLPNGPRHLRAGREDVAIKLIETLCARMRRTSVQLKDVMYPSLPARLAKTLLELTGGSRLLLRNARYVSYHSARIG